MLWQWVTFSTVEEKFKLEHIDDVEYHFFVLLDLIKVVTLQGKPRVSKKQISELHFHFQIESISEYIEKRDGKKSNVVNSNSIYSLLTGQRTGLPQARNAGKEFQEWRYNAGNNWPE